MKIMTINAHSLMGNDNDMCLRVFSDVVSENMPDIIALQEANQRKAAPIVMLGNGFNVREDNFALNLCKRLYDGDTSYGFVWQGVKYAYDIYEEGIALMFRLPVIETDVFTISRVDDVNNWKRRMALGIRVGNEWFYSIHTGRYDDTEEPFGEQLNKINTHIKDKGRVWLMGDFNCPYESDGYKKMQALGWHDTHLMAKERDIGVTVVENIDGWRDTDIKNMRIDYIFTTENTPVKSSHTIFNGKNFDIISDHYGIEVTM